MIVEVAYAIVGGGAAAAAAIDGIRAIDPNGSIALFTSEWAPPYQRPPLSKEFLRGEAPLDSVLMHPAAWYIEKAIDIRVGVTVTAIEPSEHTIHIGDDIVRYNKLLLATGATPRHLTIPGAQLDGIFALRTYGDAQQLRAVRSSANRIVLVGSGFIGMELAASLRSGGTDVVLTSVDKALWTMFGTSVSTHVAGVFERHGVRVVLDNTIESFTGDGRVRSVETSRGSFATDNGIVVNDRLQSSARDVYAAGDVARFPSLNGALARVEHFDNADSSGRLAGGNMAGNDSVYRYVPFFWSDVFELGFEFVGSPTSEGNLVTGTFESGSFIVEYALNGKLAGVFLANRTPQESAAYRARL
jgi:3-phenylpropionate/trans-cinnamate dioxygenase ferredoxin reductase subunit